MLSLNNWIPVFHFVENNKSALCTCHNAPLLQHVMPLVSKLWEHSVAKIVIFISMNSTCLFIYTIARLHRPANCSIYHICDIFWRGKFTLKSCSRNWMCQDFYSVGAIVAGCFSWRHQWFMLAYVSLATYWLQKRKPSLCDTNFEWSGFIVLIQPCNWCLQPQRGIEEMR